MTLALAGSAVPHLLRSTALILAAASMISGGSAADDVFLQFYMDQVKLWDQQGQQAKLQSAILPGLQAYCGKAVNFATCGINSTSNVSFSASDVQISPGYPVNWRGRYLNVRFKVSYSVGSGVVTLPAAAVTEIAQNQREAVSADVGYYVVFINDDIYSVPPPTMANKVIVPMFVAGTCVLILVALALRHYHAGRQKKYLRKLGREQKSSRNNKVGASATDLVAAAQNDVATGRKDKSNPDDEKKPKKKKKKKLGGVEWGGSGKTTKGSANKTSEFNNVGFDKSMNEGDPRANRQDVAGDPAVDPRASQSALSEVIQVRGGGSDGGDKKKSKKTPPTRGKHASSSGGGVGGSEDVDKGGKKSLSTTRNKDSEEVMLMDAGVFTPPEANVPEDRGRVEDSEDDSDNVPTLRDSSVQQMI